MSLSLLPSFCSFAPAIVTFCEQPALLRCWGDEDTATRGSRRTALSRALAAKTDVVVDLRGLRFADASFIVDLAIVARRLRLAGQALRVCDAQPQVLRLIMAVGMHRLPGVVLDTPASMAL